MKFLLLPLCLLPFPGQGQPQRHLAARLKDKLWRKVKVVGGNIKVQWRPHVVVPSDVFENNTLPNQESEPGDHLFISPNDGNRECTQKWLVVNLHSYEGNSTNFPPTPSPKSLPPTTPSGIGLRGSVSTSHTSDQYFQTTTLPQENIDDLYGFEAFLALDIHIRIKINNWWSNMEAVLRGVGDERLDLASMGTSTNVHSMNHHDDLQSNNRQMGTIPAGVMVTHNKTVAGDDIVSGMEWQVLVHSLFNTPTAGRAQRSV